MSTINSKNVQVGTSSTASQNFTLYQPATPDGTVRLGVGNSGATTLDAVTVTSAGNVTVSGSLTATTLSGAVTGGAVTATSLAVNGNNISAVNSLGFRNRLINSDMRIDQRNNGASVNATDGLYTLDRWRCGASANSVFSVQRSTLAPSGFTNSMLLTSLAATSLGATSNFEMFQYIEGFNSADLAWGTASAQTITVSFWVRSSLTGTFGGAINNSAFNRSYPFSYTINAANTWEQKSITIAGDTSGTWLTDNGTGLILCICIGAGATRSGTAGVWAGSWFASATGAVNLVGTNGATFYITGVQLEAGTVASPFERRDYGRELMMCQRYYEKSYDVDVVPGSNASGSWDGPLAFISGAGFGYTSPAYFKATKRATPTITGFPENGGASGTWRSQTSAGTVTARTFGTSSLNTNSFTVLLQTSDVRCFGHWTASAEL